MECAAEACGAHAGRDGAMTQTRTRAARVLAIGLDGYEPSVGDAMMAAGELPALRSLRDRSARFLLDHGAATRTGLAWEHVSSGRSPEAADHWSAVDFDTETYRVWQQGTSLEPFPARLAARTVVFDPPYFDLARAPSVRGLVGWGAHDPGVANASRPAGVAEEIAARFGPYPASEWTYGIVWASASRARAMGETLARAVDVRAKAARWLLAERCPDWDLGIVVTGELHSAIEGLWHGIDPSHPLYSLPSAKPAGDGLREVYRATDRLVGELIASFPDATVVAFAMNGMGPNRSDVTSMALLAELLYRRAFGRALLRVPRAWTAAPRGVPLMEEDEDWSRAVNSRMHPVHRLRRRVRRVAERWLPAFAGGSGAPDRGRDGGGAPERDEPVGREHARGLHLPLDWMPAALYQPYWHAMRAFALPSFYDGRIRINLAGRERCGLVEPSGYEQACDEVERLLRACRDPYSGEPIVSYVERTGGADPLALGPSESDMVVVWHGAALAIEHPEIGRIGPIPYRRTGGHTGPYGIAYVAGAGTRAGGVGVAGINAGGIGDFGVRSSFDVVPTIVALLGEPLPAGLSGTSLLDTAGDARTSVAT
jgi:predicted AlkP superfamily phosphohydrolase/phosphomutase